MTLPLLCAAAGITLLLLFGMRRTVNRIRRDLLEQASTGTAN
jgi:hypothetical protein